MRLVASTVAISLWLTTAAAKSAFTSIEDISPESDAHPYSPWNSRVRWEIPQGAKANEEFTLHMPYISGFTHNYKNFELKYDGHTYAICNFTPGESSVHYSEVRCRTTDAVEKYGPANGISDFSFAFNAGFSDSPSDMESAKHFTPGDNKIVWTSGPNELTSNVDFVDTPLYVFDTDYDSGVYDLRVEPNSGKIMNYFMGAADNNQGTLKIEVTKGDFKFDCDNVRMSSTQGVNAWGYPLTNEHPDYYRFSIKSCTDKKLHVEYGGLPNSYRGYINAPGKLLSKTKDLEIAYTRTKQGWFFQSEDTKRQVWHVDYDGPSEDNAASATETPKTETPATETSQASDNGAKDVKHKTDPSRFSSIKKLSSSSHNAPGEPWDASVDWKIPGDAKSGEEFTLHMPYVYGFTHDYKNYELKHDGHTYAVCNFTPGETSVNYSEIRCITTDAVEKYGPADGSSNFSIAFNAGFPGTPNDLESAKLFTPGDNEIVWTSGSNRLTWNADFSGSPSYHFDSGFESGGYDLRHDQQTGKILNYLMGPADNPNGDFRIEVINGGFKFDCDNIRMAGTKDVNAWGYPLTNEHPKYGHFIIRTCTDTKIIAQYTSLGNGYRAFIIAPGELTSNSQFLEIDYERSKTGMFFESHDNKRQIWNFESSAASENETGEASNDGAKNVSRFSSIEELSSSSDNAPGKPWNARVRWEIPENAKPGEEFTLHMPHVNQFTSSAQDFELSDSRSSYAKCSLFSGEDHVGYSEIKCTTTTAVQEFGEAFGTHNFTFTFNVGFADSPTDLESAKHFTPGNNEIIWTSGPYDLKSNVNFSDNPSYYFEHGFDSGIYDLRHEPNSPDVLNYMLAPIDNNIGDFRIEVINGDFKFDCDNVHLAATKDINPWGYPVTTEHPDYTKFTIKACTDTKVIAEYTGLPNGYRAFLVAPGKSKTDYLEIDYTRSRQRGIFAPETHRRQIWSLGGGLNPDDSHPTPDDSKTTVITSYWTGTVASTTTVHATDGDEVIVLKPTPVTQITSFGPVSETTTTTIPATDGDSETRIVIIPTPTTEFTSYWTGTETSTTTVHGTDGDEVIVLEPTPVTQITSFGPVSETTTTTILATNGGSETIIVVIPTPTTEFTSYWTGTETSTTTVHGTDGDEVIVLEPTPVTSFTSFWTGTETSTTTIHGTDGDEVIVLETTPVTSFTSYWTGTETSTTTVHGTDGDEVIVLEPTPVTSYTSYWDKTETTTTTVYETDGNKVIVVLPTPVTSLSGHWTGTETTTTTIHGTDGDQVIVLEPTSYPETTTTDSNEEGTSKHYIWTITEWGIQRTVEVPAGGNNYGLLKPIPTVTTTETWSNEYTSSHTITGGIGETGTVVVDVPTPAITSTSFWQKSTETTTTIHATDGGPDTVVVIRLSPATTHTITHAAP